MSEQRSEENHSIFSSSVFTFLFITVVAFVDAFGRHNLRAPAVQLFDIESQTIDFEHKHYYKIFEFIKRVSSPSFKPIFTIEM